MLPSKREQAAVRRLVRRAERPTWFYVGMGLLFIFALADRLWGMVTGRRKG